MQDQRTCRQCGKPFKPQQAHQVFCPSVTEQEKKIGRSACSWRWTTAEARKRNGKYKSQRECVVCGATFLTVKHNAKYCSTGTGSCEAQARSIEYRQRDDIFGLAARRAETAARVAAAVIASVTAEPTQRQDAAYRRALRSDPCAYCGEQPASGIDHILPAAKHTDRKAWSNMTGCCKRCNAIKSTLPLLLALPWIPVARTYHDIRREVWAKAA